MISYAQNGEDVVLARAFADRTDGFYVDLGAADPVRDSVTKHFYDLGWRGVNVEPLPELHAALQAARPRDVNLCLGIGSSGDARTFFESIGAPGLSTFDPTAAEQAARVAQVVERIVPTMTLLDLFERHVEDRPVDFLKIDVEGLEREVIASGDWFRFRPRVLVIEGDPERVRDLLISASYDQTLFDGINSFWVRQEDARLRPAVSLPAQRLTDRFQPWYDLFALRAAVSALLTSRLREHGCPQPGAAATEAVAHEYAARADLRAAFGEGNELDTLALFRWAVDAARRGEAPALEPHLRDLIRVADEGTR